MLFGNEMNAYPLASCAISRNHIPDNRTHAGLWKRNYSIYVAVAKYTNVKANGTPYIFLLSYFFVFFFICVCDTSITKGLIKCEKCIDEKQPATIPIPWTRLKVEGAASADEQVDELGRISHSTQIMMSQITKSFAHFEFHMIFGIWTKCRRHKCKMLNDDDAMMHSHTLTQCKNA